MKTGQDCRVRRGVFLLIGVLFFLLPFSLFSEEGDSIEVTGDTEAAGRPVVTVRPLQSSDDPRAEQLAQTIEETMELSLKLLGLYEVKSLPEEVWNSPEGTGVEDLENTAFYDSFSVEHRVDNIIFGRVEQEGSTVEVVLSVYSRERGEVALTREGKAESFLDVFSLTDELTLALLEGFTRQRLAFGRVEFKNTGEPRDYFVYFDGNELGKNVRALDKVLAGEHRLQIVERFPSAPDEPRLVTDRMIGVSEGETVTLEFSVPFLYEEDRRELTERDRMVRENWNNPLASPPKVEEVLRENINYVTNFQIPTYKLLEEKYRLWLEFYKESREDRVLPKDLKLEEERIPFPFVHPAAASAEPAGKAGSRFLDLFSPLRDAVFIPYKEIDLEREGWEGIKPTFFSDTPDRLPQYPGTDLTNAYLAYDDEFIYWRMEFADGTPEPVDGMGWEMSFSRTREARDSRFLMSLRVNTHNGKWYGRLRILDMEKANQGGEDALAAYYNDGFDVVIGDGKMTARFPLEGLKAFFEYDRASIYWGNAFTWSYDIGYENTADSTPRRHVVLSELIEIE